MKISENVIIVLENKERYIVLNEINYEENKYYLLMGIDDNNDVISSKVVFIKTEEDENGLFIVKINDELLIKKLTKVLKNK
jgi:hypothetical protein